MRARFTRVAAHAEILIGVLIIVAGAALAILAFVIWPEIPSRRPLPPREELLARVAVTLTVFGAGVAVGTPFIVFGQLVLIFLETRGRLARIDHLLRRREHSTKRDSSLTERLRPR